MEEKINIKSDEITEILGTPPRWIIRWGITVIFSVIGIVFIGSIFFKYPDTVIAPAVITAENPPSVVIARANGKPAALFIADGSYVSRGTKLGVIENPAQHTDVFDLSLILEDFSHDSISSISRLLNYQKQNKRRVLGELQPPFNAFSRAVNDLLHFQAQDFHQLKGQALRNEYQQYQQHYARLLSQQGLVTKELALTRQQFARDSSLYANNVIAAVEYENAQAALLAKQQALENTKLNLSNTAITMARLKQSIVDNQLDYQSQQKQLTEEVENTHRQLSSSLAAWRHTYLLLAPTSGKLSYMNVWSSNQEIRMGEPIFAITPEDIGEVQARLVIPFQGGGKVQAGQRVNIKLDGYSFMEFGMVEGSVLAVSSGYTEEGFPTVVRLPQGAVTSYGLELPIDRELHGLAEITTEDISLIQRLFSPLKHLYKSKVKGH